MLYFPFFRPLFCLAPDAGGASGGMDAGDSAPQAEAAAQDVQEPEAQADAQAAPAAEGLPEQAQQTEPDTQRAPENAQKTEETETPQALRERVAAMQAKLVEYQLRTAAALSGVAKERIPYVMRMADVAGLDPSAADAAERYQQAIDKVLEIVPELRGGAGTGGTGNFARKPVKEADPDMARIEKNILGM